MESKNLREEIIRIAKSCIGVSYMWGGESLDGFDCSGLMQYIYAQLGKEIGRTTYDQVKTGISVAISDIQIGDLLFFGDISAPHHVGMYLGNGCYIQAPKTGDVVKISNLSDRNDLKSARRIISDDNKIEPLKEIKHYLGDIKYVLYQYVSDLNNENITFICGKYAFNKLKNMTGFKENINNNVYIKGQINTIAVIPKNNKYSGCLDLNGENIKIFNLQEVSKKQILILRGYLMMKKLLVDNIKIWIK